ncbi:phosphoglycerate dehydrogenase-like enzyme [Tamaricihabitans halophyticus]|uniref:Phosphoglycerate dehydrogenase-like enzyme n=1 Tax=Tamaricihabitans halophyticus TaxID=1262583 RepID=A0A4R2QY81_9PSEU|nr:2-hydroxyacid dehydrogenase [Tamaricihabitans halophyticus]TCP52081.1 phosphoglycerate dehydrogenase-like enzyme [Tamaricihabitans halophyticus]
MTTPPDFLPTVTVLVPDAAGLDAFAEVAGVTAVHYDPERPFPAELSHAEVLIPGFAPSGERLAGLPKLRLVQLLSAGAEAWIDQLPAGLLLSTCRGAHGGSTAEWAMTALLTIYREFDRFAVDTAAATWQPRRTDTLQGKRVLVLGAGDVGRQLARRLEAFDAQVTMVGLRPRAGVHGVAELPGLLGAQDAVVLTVPLTSQTEGMVDAAFLAALPDGAVLVNAARGKVVRTEALLTELGAGRLRAALDVTDPEPLPADHPLWTVRGVLLTPHVGGSCTGSRERSYAVAARQIAQFVSGELPDNLVNGEY